VDSDYVFVRGGGSPMPPDSITDWMNKFAKANNLSHMNHHAFHHTVASIMISNGIDVVIISRHLGHSSPNFTTDTYSHLIGLAKSKTSDVLASSLMMSTSPQNPAEQKN
jgi:integrase